MESVALKSTYHCSYHTHILQQILNELASMQCNGHHKSANMHHVNYTSIPPE